LRKLGTPEEQTAELTLEEQWPTEAELSDRIPGLKSRPRSRQSLTFAMALGVFVAVASVAGAATVAWRATQAQPVVVEDDTNVANR